MLRRVIRQNQPVSEPVSLAEAKNQLRIPAAQTVEDATITGYISSAREQAEQFIDRPICEADFVIVYQSVVGDSFYLGYPASSVSAVTYRDLDNVEQTIAFTYDAELNKLFFDEYVTGNDLKVSITSGQTSDYPQSLKQGILILIGDLYVGRSSSELMNKAAQTMLMPFKNRPIV